MLDTSTHCESFRNSDPATLNKTAQWQARWRAGCGGELAHGSAVRPTSSCWSVREPCDKAPSLCAQDAVMFHSPGRANAGTRDEPAGTRCRGSCASGFRQRGGMKHNGSCAWRRTSKALLQARRNEHRQQCRSFMTAVPNEARLISAGSHRLLTLPTTRYARQRVRAQRDSPSRVSDVSATGTERSGACARPLSWSRSGSRLSARWPDASRAERSAVS